VAVKNILLDTNAYVAFKRGQPEAVEIMQHAPSIGVNTVVLGELLGGFAVGKRTADNQQELQFFLASPRVIVLSVNENTAHYYATIYLDLRRKGKPIPTNDMWVAASALEHQFAIFTYDTHFDYIDGLIVVSSVADFLESETEG